MVSFNICCNFSCFALDALLQLLLLVVAAMFPTCKQLNWCVCVSRERERGRGKRVVGVHDFQLCLINCTQCKAFECCPVTVQCVFVVYPALPLSLSLSLSLAASTPLPLSVSVLRALSTFQKFSTLAMAFDLMLSSCQP